MTSGVRLREGEVRARCAMLESPVTAVTTIWAATSAIAIWAPDEPTPQRIPLSVLVAPPVAAAVTALLSLRQATS